MLCLHVNQQDIVQFLLFRSGVFHYMDLYILFLKLFQVHSYSMVNHTVHLLYYLSIIYPIIKRIPYIFCYHIWTFSILYSILVETILAYENMSSFNLYLRKKFLATTRSDVEKGYFIGFSSYSMFGT